VKKSAHQLGRMAILWPTKQTATLLLIAYGIREWKGLNWHEADPYMVKDKHKALLKHGDNDEAASCIP